ncbi:MAG: hypothetical protein JWO67_7384, partial [Streptosporangiaceae bacterium]|nr:hypothetical protein [Streptosporangiaceae bacterium]
EMLLAETLLVDKLMADSLGGESG